VSKGLNTERLKKFLALALEAAQLPNTPIGGDDAEGLILDGGSISIVRIEQSDAAPTIRAALGKTAPGLHQLWEVTEWKSIPSTNHLDPPDVADKLIGRYASDEEAARRAVMWLVEERVCNAIASESMSEAYSC